MSKIMFCKIARDLLHLQQTFWEISVLCKMFLPILSSGVNKTGKYESFLLFNILALFFVSLAVLVCWLEQLHVHSLIDSQCASRSKYKICCSEFRSDQIFRKKDTKSSERWAFSTDWKDWIGKACMRALQPLLGAALPESPVHISLSSLLQEKLLKTIHYMRF